MAKRIRLLFSAEFKLEAAQLVLDQIFRGRGRQRDGRR